MPGNPMQRKTRNAFLCGMLIMLIVALIVGAVLYFFVFSGSVATGSKDDQIVYAYRVINNISSGNSIKEGDVQVVKVKSSEVPANYINAMDSSATLSSNDVAKVDLYKGTILATSLLAKGDEDYTDNSLRIAEFNMISFPSTLKVGDYIDIRITMPNGADYSIITKKRVVNLNNTTISLYLTEEEIITMNCAIIESYIMTASNIYAMQYVDAGMQEKAIQTYPVNSAVYALAISNSNIVADARKALAEKYANTGSTIRRNYIDPQISQYVNRLDTATAPYLEDVNARLQEQIDAAREAYLSGLAGY